jgi:hypothetical protein
MSKSKDTKKESKGKPASGSGKQKAGPGGSQNRQMDTSRSAATGAGSNVKSPGKNAK